MLFGYCQMKLIFKKILNVFVFPNFFFFLSPKAIELSDLCNFKSYKLLFMQICWINYWNRLLRKKNSYTNLLSYLNISGRFD